MGWGGKVSLMNTSVHIRERSVTDSLVLVDLTGSGGHANTRQFAWQKRLQLDTLCPAQSRWAFYTFNQRNPKMRRVLGDWCVKIASVSLLFPNVTSLRGSVWCVIWARMRSFNALAGMVVDWASIAEDSTVVQGQNLLDFAQPKNRLGLGTSGYLVLPSERPEAEDGVYGYCVYPRICRQADPFSFFGCEEIKCSSCPQ